MIGPQQIGIETLFASALRCALQRDLIGTDIMDNQQPYIEEEVVTIERRYNPNYGDDRVCECGHTYYRHFDPWEDMRAVGCKYCDCYIFVEKKT